MTTAKHRTEDPTHAMALHNHLQGLWWDGRPMTRGGTGGRWGNFSEIPIKWMYPGMPPTHWSEMDFDDQGTAVSPSDRTVLSGMGPFVLSPNQPQEILIGLITSFGADHLDSVRQLKEDDVFIQGLVDQGLLDSPPPHETYPEEFELAASFFPIPASANLELLYSVPEEMPVLIDVYDLLGRRRGALVDKVESPGAHTRTIDVSGWRPGVYLARLQIGHRTFTRKLVVVR